jgi:hypothetical protein
LTSEVACYCTERATERPCQVACVSRLARGTRKCVNRGCRPAVATGNSGDAQERQRQTNDMCRKSRAVFLLSSLIPKRSWVATSLKLLDISARTILEHSGFNVHLCHCVHEQWSTYQQATKKASAKICVRLLQVSMRDMEGDSIWDVQWNLAFECCTVACTTLHRLSACGYIFLNLGPCVRACDQYVINRTKQPAAPLTQDSTPTICHGLRATYSRKN